MPILEWTDFSGIQQTIVDGNNALQPLTPEQVKATTGARPFLTESGVEYFNFESSGSGSYGADFSTDFPGTSASQASQQYIGAGGQTSAGGAATTGGKVVKTGNYTLTQKASQAGTGAMSIGALLSVNLPTAAAAIAPIAGVAIGAGLYASNPELWEKISRALLPFCYKDTELMPVIADEDGNTYFSKSAIDAVRQAIEEVGGDIVAGDPPGTEFNLADVVSPFPFPVSNVTSFERYIEERGEKIVLTYNANIPVKVCAQFNQYPGGTNSSWYINAASEVPFTLTRTDYSGNIANLGVYETTYNGKTFYQCLDSAGGATYVTGISIPTFSYIGNTPVYFNEMMSYSMLYGTEVQRPEGISDWTGKNYPDDPATIGIVTGIAGSVVSTEPFFPITMPVGDPGVTNDPLEVPGEPTTNPNPDPAINPWITPSPAPGTYPGDVPQSNPAQLPDPIPNYNPNLDPNNDPSQQPEQQPQPEPDPAQSPGNSGTSQLPQLPLIPILPSSAKGLLHVYNPTQSQIDAFGSWLWTTFSGDLIDTVSKLFNDPMDAVIGLHELYATPSVSGASTIKAGFLDSGVSSNVVGSRYTSINCGSIVVQEYYQNYLDYSPYTKCFLYLPFVGIVSVLADDIIGNAVNITYHIDSYTGCCIAVVTVAREGYSSTVYQFEGNCAVEIPITSGYQSTLMGAMLGIAGTALTGSPHVGLSAANLGRASLGKNDVSHSGSFGASYGAMGAKIPYIIVKRPTQKSVVNYNQEYGFPAHKRVTIGACSGYLRAREVHVISPTATDEEKARIEELLKEGVFVK